LSAWTLRSATAISDDGTKIVGNGDHVDGYRSAFIASIPEPSSLTILVVLSAAASFFPMPHLARRQRFVAIARLSSGI
jgi:hypothetical protein